MQLFGRQVINAMGLISVRTKNENRLYIYNFIRIIRFYLYFPFFPIADIKSGILIDINSNSLVGLFYELGPLVLGKTSTGEWDVSINPFSWHQ